MDELLVLDSQIAIVNKANITEIDDCGTQEDKFLQVWNHKLILFDQKGMKKQ